MIDLLPKWRYPDSSPAFYDTESVTAIEGVAKMGVKINELIEDYNSFVDTWNKKISEFEYSTTEELETFEKAMRQEFQDFIDVINIKYLNQEERIESTITRGLNEVKTSISRVLNELEEARKRILSDVEVIGNITQTTGNSETLVMSQNAVTQELEKINEDIYIRSSNKYNPSLQTEETISPHYYVNGNPYETTQFDNKFNCTALIPVNPSTEYTVGLVPKIVEDEWGSIPWRNSASGLFQYDENGNHINGTSTTNNTFITTEATRYIRFNYSIANNIVTLDVLNARCVLVEGNTLPNEYIPYINESVKDIAIKTSEELKNKADAHSIVMMPIRYFVDGDKIDIVSKLNNNYDVVLQLKKKGGNNLFDIFGFYVIANQSEKISETLEGLIPVVISDSDWFAPFKVSAINNIDGDNIESAHFTGGNHQYNNIGEGSTPTARTISLQFYADNIPITESGSCNKIKIKWTNRVQAYNTKKADGTGREVLEEIHTLIFDGTKIECEVELNPLETINIKRWYGFQGFGAKSVFKNIKYVGGINRGVLDGSLESTSSGNKDPNMIIAYGDKYSLSIEIDRSYDLGKCILSNSIKGMFTEVSTGKIYCDVINENGLNNGASTVLNSGDRYFLRGFYKFDSVNI